MPPKFGLQRGLGDQQFTVTGIAPILNFAAEKAQHQISATANPVGPIWSVRIIKEDGKVDVDMLLKAASQRKTHVHHVFNVYAQHRVPVSILARALGSDPVTMIREWPESVAQLFVGVGTHEERNAAIAHSMNSHARFAVDLVTLAELQQRGMLEVCAKLIGKPLVSHTFRARIKTLLQLLRAPRGGSSMTEVGGALQMTDVPESYFESHEAALISIEKFVDEHCEVVPAIGPGGQ